MNMLFIPVVSFGVLFLGVIIAGIIFNAKVGGTSKPAPWMRRVRQFQNERENAGWRIQMIPYNETSKPMTMNLSGTLAMVPVVGALGFISGLALATYDGKHVKSGIIFAVSSWVVAICGYWLNARAVRRDWDVAPARCVDRELRRIWMPGADGGGAWGWFWRVVCEYEYLGIPCRVTPEVYWANFTSEEAAREFLEARVSPNGQCMLLLNPKNTLRTELLDQGIKDKLLY